MSQTVPLRVLIVANDPPGSAVYRYRAAHLAEGLQSAGVAADARFVGESRIRVDHDVVILHRICWNRTGQAFARAARDCGAALVYSTDDYIWDEQVLRQDAHLPPEVEKWLIRFAPLHLRAAQEADGLLVSTSYLHRKIGECLPGKPCQIVPNGLSAEQVRLSDEAARHAARSPATVTLGYLSGSRYHDADLTLVAPTLDRLFAAHPHLRLHLAGPVTLPPVLERWNPSRIERLPWVNWTELPAVIARCDINLAPLDESRPLNQGRSAIKWWEAAAVEVPTVASPTAGFRDALEGAPAALCDLLPPTVDAWEGTLSRLIADITAAKAASAAPPCGEMARDWAMTSGTVESQRETILAAMRRFAELPRARPARARPRVVNWPVSFRQVTKELLRRGRGR